VKLVTFLDESGARLGVLQGARVIDVEASARRQAASPADATFASMQGLIEGGETALAAVRALLREPSALVSRPLDGVRLAAPLPRPLQMRDFMCFEEHLANCLKQAARGATPPPIPQIWYELPAYYTCNALAVVGPEAEIPWPRYAQLLDYELEFAAVIGKKGKDIPRERALEHVFGYTIFNDVSARDTQMKEMAANLGPGKGKDFDGGNVLGPCIVTADEIDPYALTMVARVNGEEWSRGHSGAMHHRFEDCIAHVSRSATLHPGELLCSGTVGTGCGLEQGRFLSPGDVVELEVEGIGVLRNRIAKGE
jgi:2-keto-4-pentenoate hydratase/2-oxohepta-3-ene-1,7-dioic acid hydratase in catechol pathway